MIEAVPLGFFSLDFELYKHRRPIATLDVSAWRETAEVEIEGDRYRFRREGMVSGAFLLERGDEVIARAVKPSAFKSRFDLEVRGRSYTLRRVSGLRREFGLYVHNQRVGGVTPQSWFTRRSTIRVPDGWTPPLQAFLFWLVLIIWKRDHASSGG